MKRKLDNLRSNVVAWLTKHKKPVTGISLVVLVAVIGGSLVLAWQVDETIERTNFSNTTAEPSQPELSFEASPLTGLDVAPDLASRPVTAVIVENSPEARPQSGLNEAGIIYEAIAEGGITRFLTLFQEARPQTIGPVRSIRPYFNDFVLQYDASIAHVGGSTQALAEIGPRGIKDLDEFANSGAYWKDSGRFAPHNTYTSFDNLDNLNSQKGFNSSDFEPFVRKEDAALAEPTATDITIDVSSFLYNPNYKYKKATNTYDRYMGGNPHKDRETGETLSPNVVVALEMSYRVLNDVGHNAVGNTGSGVAYVFQDGRAIKGTWERKGKEGDLILKNGNGGNIKLNKGQTWITILPTGNSVSY